MTRILFAALLVAGATTTASAQYPRPLIPSTPHPPGTYNFNNPVYHGVYPPTGYYPGGVVSSHAYTNLGDTIPTTYITHYRSAPPIPVYYPPVPTVGYYYTESIRVVEYAPPMYPGHGRVRWR